MGDTHSGKDQIPKLTYIHAWRPSKDAPMSPRFFPNTVALYRFSACVLIEAHGEWHVSDRRYLSETSMGLLTSPELTALPARPAHTGGDRHHTVPYGIVHNTKQDA